jgi:uncharacterized protein YfiM (DUF2279 family)
MRLPVLLLACLQFAFGAGEACAQEGPEAPLSLYEQRRGWLSQDKAYHFAVSAAGSAGVYAIAREAGMSRRQGAITATLLMGAAGFFREALDFDDPNRLISAREFSRKDMVWNSAGIIVGITVSDRLLRHRWNGRDDEPPVTPR